MSLTQDDKCTGIIHSIQVENFPCENEVGFIGTVLELSGTHFNGTFWDNH